MKPLEWISSAKDDLLDLPSDVQNVMGYGLYLAQIGDKYDDAKPLKGFKGAGDRR
jgi:phage-related protein